MATSKSLLLAIAFFTGVLASSAFAQRKNWQTYPMPPRAKKTINYDRMWLSGEVPEAPEKLKIVTSSKFDGRDIGSTEIFVFGFDRSGKRYTVGTIAEGTEIKITDFDLKGETLYYTLPWEAISPTVPVTGMPPRIAWISGRNLKVVGPNTN